jgi:hypothetical protein
MQLFEAICKQATENMHARQASQLATVDFSFGFGEFFPLVLVSEPVANNDHCDRLLSEPGNTVLRQGRSPYSKHSQGNQR